MKRLGIVLVLCLGGFVMVGCSSTNEIPPGATHFNTQYNDSVFGRPRHGRQNDGDHATVEARDGTFVRVDAATRSARAEYERLSAQERLMAYEQGVRDTMEEMAGRARAQQGFIWQEPIVERVWVPGAAKNGAFIPGHYETVVVSPGRWIEANGVALPHEDLGSGPRQNVKGPYDDGR